MFVVSPIFTLTISFSLTSTLTSIIDRSAILRSSVPAICEVPTTLSPSSTLRRETVPVIGATILVFLRFSSDSSTVAFAPFTLYSLALTLCLLDSRSWVDTLKFVSAISYSESEITFWSNNDFCLLNSSWDLRYWASDLDRLDLELKRLALTWL